MKHTKKIAIASLCGSLGVIFLYLGVILNVLDMTVALLASMLVLFCVMELGYGYAFAVYAIISVLALLLLPNPSPAWMFIALFGYIPITKFGLEKFLKKFAWIPKLLLFNLSFAAVIFLGGEVLGFTTENQFGISRNGIYIAFFILGNFLYIMCDILYGRLVQLYMIRFRDKIKKYLK
ncbi:MAG: hypothetical protein IJ489_10515 [Clostridia bacterium]|nr:hypothetical protein [Clostridia bacterium]